MSQDEEEDFGPLAWSAGKGPCRYCGNYYPLQEMQDHVDACPMKGLS